MTKNNSRSIFSIASLLFLLAVTAAIILYQKGYYDISFIERPVSAEDTEGQDTDIPEKKPSDTASDVGTSPSEGETAGTVSGNISSMTNPNSITTSASQGEASPNESAKDGAKAFLESLAVSSAEREKGSALTDADYSSAQHQLTRLEIGAEIPNAMSLSKNTRSYKKYNEDTNKVDTVSEAYERPVVELYMGMVFLDDGNTVSLVDDEGNVRMVGFDDVAFAYERDEYERPLFTYKNGYYYINDDYELKWSNFNEAFGYPVKHDALTSYNQPNQGLYIYYVEKTMQYISNAERIYKMEKQQNRIIEPEYEEEKVKLYGYMDANGNVVIEAQYYYAFNFGPEGYAVVADRDRVMKLIDKRGREIVNPHGRIVRQKDRNNYNAIMGYYLPETDTDKAIGTYFFDHGLTRVRCELRDYFDIGQIVGDYDLLITPSGKEFEMPEGYNLVSYSDGVLLLERDGRYGCMDYTGRWIAQPIYTYARPFYEGLCVLGFSDGKKGMIDTSGNIVIPFAFDHISDVSCGRIAVYDAYSGWNVLEKLEK